MTKRIAGGIGVTVQIDMIQLKRETEKVALIILLETEDPEVEVPIDEEIIIPGTPIEVLSMEIEVTVIGGLVVITEAGIKKSY